MGQTVGDTGQTVGDTGFYQHHLPEAFSIARNSIMSVSYMIITIITSGINHSMHNNLVINIFLLQEISELWKLQTQYMYYYSEY